ncbi:hypothetical protein [Cryptosporangium sp. NPDC051539]|uniref:hypothetical protein n=1 Tax=Cryptosporangium sp. NPDC051539 TaxID=3363962 RepID=UPI0037A8FA6A
MADSMEVLEERIDELRRGVRRSAIAGDRAAANRLRAELRRAEKAWDEALMVATGPETHEVVPEPDTPLVSVREQVHQVLTFLTVPAAPKLIAAVRNAVFAGGLSSTQFASIRRDEERSFRQAPGSRPYYICAALTSDRLSPARGLLAVSTWPMAARIVAPLSPRVHFLTAAIRISEQVSGSGWDALPVRRLLWQFAANIPGGARSLDTVTPEVVESAARAELEIHYDADRSQREVASRRAREQLDDYQQMFGSALGLASLRSKEQ